MDCNKKCFPSRSIAKEVMKKINKKYGTDYLKDVHFCEYHQSWHTTSMSKKKSRHYTKILNKNK